MQINLQHSRVATANLMQLTEEENIDILSIQEPYIIQNQVTGIPHKYTIYTIPNTRSRAAIVITNKQIDAILLKQLSEADAVVAEVTINGEKLVLASMYFDIERQIEIDLAKIDNILQHANGKGVILTIDSNARSTSWHDITTNARGKKLDEYLMSKHLYIMNEESSDTTFRTRRGASNIDLTIVTDHLLRMVTQWKISDQESSSDHSIIEYIIGHDDTSRENNITQNEVRYLTKKENHPIFRNNLTQLAKEMLCRLHNEETTEDLDAMLSTKIAEAPDIGNSIEEFHGIIKKACDKAYKTQSTPKKTTHKSVPWWTDELTTIRKRTNALRRRYQRTKNNEELRERRKNQYLGSKAHYAATIQREKIKSWKEYCNITTAANPWNEIYKLAANKRKRHAQLTTLQKPDGTLTSNLEETAKLMLEHFTPEDSIQDDTELHKQIRLQSQRIVNTPDDRNFTLTEIKNAVESMDNRKAPGEDGITGEIFKQIFETFPNYITTMYNECLRKGTFPNRWKRAKLIPIVKPGKEGSEQVTKYRPISLLNIEGKIMEKLLISRINYWAYSTNFINTNQYGFTPQRSTVDAAMAVKNIVEEGLLAGEVIILVSLDIKTAFDAAWWPNILKSLQELGCPRNLYYLTKNYLSQRTAILSTNTIKLERQITKGCPQGSCCSPGLWNIQYNSLLNLKFAKQTSAIAFADDLILVTRGKTVIEAENFTNTELNKIATWAKNYKVEFNDNKSTAMLVSRRKRKERKDINIFLNFKLLKQVNKMKYLGIIMDNKFKFNEHITYAAAKCTKLIYSLSKSAKLTWGLRHNVLRTIYEGAILPLLMYGAPVWEDAMKYDHNRKKYMRTQRLINIRIAKAFCTTSNEALCIVANTAPIMLKFEEVVKIYNVRKGRGKQIHNIDREVHLKLWQHPADEAKFLDTNENKDRLIQAYTDGSKTQHGVGSGVAIFIGTNLALQDKFKLDSNCSNNQAEQLAIIKALEAIGNIDTTTNSQRTVTIFTDSMITLESIRNTKNHNYLIEEIRKKMTTLEQAHWNIEISWVKAHIGIMGNELADRLAKTAANDNDNEIIFSRLPIGTIINKIKEKTMQKWQKEWEECSKAEITKKFFPKIQDRQKLRIEIFPVFTAMVTGHGKTRAYLHRFKILENANCPCGEGDQTVDHLLNRCPMLNTQRERFKHNVLKTGIWPPKEEDILSKHLKPFLQFIKSINFDLL